MNKSLQTFLLTNSSSRFNSNHTYRGKRNRWLKNRIGNPCYLCGVATTKAPVPAGEKPQPTHITLEHYVPVWFLKAIQLPEAILHKPNFRVCCLECNYKRGFRIRTIKQLREDIGDELVDKLMIVADVYLSDEYSI